MVDSTEPAPIGLCLEAVSLTATVTFTTISSVILLNNDGHKIDFICSKTGFFYERQMTRKHRNKNTRGLLSGLCRREVKRLRSFVDKYSYLKP